MRCTARRNLSAYQRSVLALKLEDIFKAKARENQGTRTDLLQNSPKSLAPINTRLELAKIAGVSDNTIAKVKVVEEKAIPEQRAEIAAAKSSIHPIPLWEWYPGGSSQGQKP